MKTCGSLTTKGTPCRNKIRLHAPACHIHQEVSVPSSLYSIPIEVTYIIYDRLDIKDLVVMGRVSKNERRVIDNYLQIYPFFGIVDDNGYISSGNYPDFPYLVRGVSPYMVYDPKEGVWWLTQLKGTVPKFTSPLITKVSSIKEISGLLNAFTEHTRFTILARNRNRIKNEVAQCLSRLMIKKDGHLIASLVVKPGTHIVTLTQGDKPVNLVSFPAKGQFIACLKEKINEYNYETPDQPFEVEISDEGNLVVKYGQKEDHKDQYTHTIKV